MARESGSRVFRCRTQESCLLNCRHQLSPGNVIRVLPCTPAQREYHLPAARRRSPITHKSAAGGVVEVAIAALGGR